jgi:protocatechuate 3,4-dioxygenase beta subunit
MRRRKPKSKSPLPLQHALLDSLESRLLLAAIQGTVWFDANENGLQDNNETGRADIAVDLLDNANDVLASTTTVADGSFEFPGLANNSYAVKFTLPPGLLLTTQNAGANDAIDSDASPLTGRTAQVTLSDEQPSADLDAGAVNQRGSITGVVFNDPNVNGAQDEGEEDQDNWELYIDANNNSIRDAGERTATTGDTGTYAFTNVLPGALILRLTAKSGWRQTVPNPFTVNLDAGADLVGQNLGVVQPATIRGVAYIDLDASGTRDNGDNVLVNRVFFIDANDDGLVDVGETTAATNNLGEYTFANLLPGAYRLRPLPISGWRVTSPIAGYYDAILTPTQIYTDKNFGLFYPGTISGAAYEDNNGDGIKNGIEAGIENLTVFIDDNANGILDDGEVSDNTDATGAYSFSSLEYGSYLIQFVLPNDAVYTAPLEGHAAAQALGARTTTQNFGYAFPTTISGTVFVDANLNSTLDNGETPIAGWTVYLDTNNNSILDNGESSTQTNDQGAYSFANLSPRAYYVRSVPFAGWLHTSPDIVSLTLSSHVPATANFAAIQAASIAGHVFNDLNGNGTKDPSELAVPNWRVFIDTNNNGVWNKASERFYITDGDGLYLFDDLLPGTYTIQPTLYRGWRLTSPDAAPEIAVVSGQQIANADFLLTTKVHVSGYIFNDRNQNGIYDRREKPIAGWRVFIDSNNNGVWDKKTERSLLTDNKGFYLFTDLPTGTLHLRAFKYKGYKPTTGANYRPLSSPYTDIFSNQDFGQFPTQ